MSVRFGSKADARHHPKGVFFYFTMSVRYRPKADAALHFAHYNFVRIHKTLTVTPAMEVSIVDDLWTIHDLLRITDRYI